MLNRHRSLPHPPQQSSAFKFISACVQTDVANPRITLFHVSLREPVLSKTEKTCRPLFPFSAFASTLTAERACEVIGALRAPCHTHTQKHGSSAPSLQYPPYLSTLYSNTGLELGCTLVTTAGVRFCLQSHCSSRPCLLLVPPVCWQTLAVNRSDGSCLVCQPYREGCFSAEAHVAGEEDLFKLRTAKQSVSRPTCTATDSNPASTYMFSYA